MKKIWMLTQNIYVLCDNIGLFSEVPMDADFFVAFWPFPMCILVSLEVTVRFDAQKKEGWWTGNWLISLGEKHTRYNQNIQHVLQPAAEKKHSAMQPLLEKDTKLTIKSEWDHTKMKISGEKTQVSSPPHYDNAWPLSHMAPHVVGRPEPSKLSKLRTFRPMKKWTPRFGITIFNLVHTQEQAIANKHL